MDINSDIESPFVLKVSFNKLIEQYESLVNSKDALIVSNAERVLEIARKNPFLTEGFSDSTYFTKYKAEISGVLQDTFNPVLTQNEIKTASIPFQNVVFNSSQRFKSIIANAGEGYNPQIKNMPTDDKYIIACTIILNTYYGYSLNFRRPFFYEIPNNKGIMRYYKILYNADFIEIEATDKAINITQDDFEELLDNFENIEIWKEKFPPNSYVFKGFVLSNIFDVTDDRSISNIKSRLISEGKRQDPNFMYDLHEAFRSLFDIKDLHVGFFVFNKVENTFERVYGEGMDSFLLRGHESVKCEDTLCSNSYHTLLEDKRFYSISDVDKYYELSEGKIPQYRILKNQGIKSAVLAPIANDQEFLGVLELVSSKAQVLNSINAIKLVDIMPYILTAVERSKREEENLIEAVIQQECTSIHSSVHWKFRKEAQQFIKAQLSNAENPTFKKIKFDNVYPLFGQIDVKGSSSSRNEATKKDLDLQLSLAQEIINKALKIQALPIYQQIRYQIQEYLIELGDNFKVDSEHDISKFLKEEVNPVLDLISKNYNLIKSDVVNYFNRIDNNLEVIYHYRKNYDDTVRLINTNMSSLLDEKQVEAQKMYPHFFERFKTDGVEHNMYIGESITKEDSFSPIFLYNLRLWQLQVMCEMENNHYQNQHKYPVALDVASMVLVFNQPLSIRFRMDEKRFDVDGTYNARYEVVKKRVDKAYIKGTTERLTLKGKLTIVYSQKEDENEYTRYIKFLQYKNLLGKDLEYLELEDLQGVTGLKALRVSILYHKTSDDRDLYTYDDLMETINKDL